MNYFFDFFDPADYSVFYKTMLVTFILLGSVILRIKENSNAYFRTDRNLLIAYVIILIFYAGTRDLSIGTDTYNYYHYYFLRGINITNPIEFFSYFQTDLMFEVVMFLTFPVRNFTFFTVILATIFNVTLYVFVRKFSDYGKDGSSLILFLTFASAFSFPQMEVNIIRNGLSISFVLISMYYMMNSKFNHAIIFFIISFLFHGTALIPITAILIAFFSKGISIKNYIVIYFIGVGLSLIGFGFHSIPFLQEINSDDFKRLAFAGETAYRIGFRPDFVAYNTFFLILFFKIGNMKDLKEQFLFKYFIITSIVFFFNFRIPFSDRIGLYSWITIPLLLFLTLKNSYNRKHLYFSSLGALGYFILNYIILFP